jgi:hypothetical protein
MNSQTNLPSDEVIPSHRGFIYFCEESLRYNKGLRAWFFFGPYLLGAVWLEPGKKFENTGVSLWSWFLLLAYLLAFPPLWRAILLRTGLWRKRSRLSTQADRTSRST